MTSFVNLPPTHPGKLSPPTRPEMYRPLSAPCCQPSHFAFAWPPSWRLPANPPPWLSPEPLISSVHIRLLSRKYLSGRLPAPGVTKPHGQFPYFFCPHRFYFLLYTFRIRSHLPITFCRCFQNRPGLHVPDFPLPQTGS